MQFHDGTTNPDQPTTNILRVAVKIQMSNNREVDQYARANK